MHRGTHTWLDNDLFVYIILDKRQKRSHIWFVRIHIQYEILYLSLTNICYLYNLIIRNVRVMLLSHSHGWEWFMSREKKSHCKSEPTRSSNTRDGKRQNDRRNLRQKWYDPIKILYFTFWRVTADDVSNKQ